MSANPFNINNHTHDYESVVTDPTCTEQGYTTNTCTICANTNTGNYRDPLGHNYVDGECTRCGDVEEHEHDYETVVTPPTCTEEGYTTYTCSACGHTYEDDFVDPLEHDWLDADCETPETCSRCGETQGEALGHDYEDGACIRCGEEDPSAPQQPSGFCGDEATWTLDLETGLLTIGEAEICTTMLKIPLPGMITEKMCRKSWWKALWTLLVPMPSPGWRI